MTAVKRFMSDESGGSLIEYALLAGFIAMAFVAAATNIGNALVNPFNDASGSLS